MLAYQLGLGLPEGVAHAITSGADPARPQIAAQVQRWASRIMSEIDSDIKRGQLPADVATWAGIDGHVDANEYLHLPGNQVPRGSDLPASGDDRAGERLLAAVEHEVERRLLARHAATAGLAALLTTAADEAGERLGLNTEQDEILTAIAEELARFAGVSFDNACQLTDGMWPAVRDAGNRRRTEIIATRAQVDTSVAAAVVERVFGTPGDGPDPEEGTGP
jgi:hypothetical protein